MISICFVFPYVGQGGVPVLFSQLANYLQINGLAIVSIVDFPHGSLSKLTNNSVKKIFYHPFKSTYIDSDYIVFQSMSPWSLYRGLIFSPSSRLFFWTLHPDNFKLFTSSFLLQLLQFLPDRISQLLTSQFSTYLRDTVNILLNNNSLVFMDKSTLSSSQDHLDLPISEPVLLPLSYTPLSNRRLSTSNYPANYSSISFAWIGRLVSFKLPGLFAFASQLNSFAESHRISIPFHVIGSGDSSIPQSFSQFKYLDFTFIPNLSLPDLESYLLSRVNFAFAMGTSALVTSSLAIPTLLAPTDSSPVDPSVSFDWLHNHTGYLLGQDSKFYRHDAHYLQKVLSTALIHYPQLSKQSFDYFQNNHSVRNTSELLLSVLKTSTLTLSDFPSPTLFTRISIFLYNILRSFALFPTLLQW